MGFQLPEIALNVALQDEKYRSYIENISLMLQVTSLSTLPNVYQFEKGNDPCIFFSLHYLPTLRFMFNKVVLQILITRISCSNTIKLWEY